MKTFKWAFKHNEEWLISKTEVSNSLLRRLRRKRILQQHHAEDIEDVRGESSRVEKLLRTHESRDDRQLVKFC
jgi:hypothetical protein